ncbi:MAG TPA: hypothetical protein VG269_09730 [Tepidisphaeraceae bacterium]|jgi:hypothetical protein|nr:hypothetical protein [Tepidisphaeraceae bacterium]
MPVKNKWLEGIWDGHPFQKLLFFALWIPTLVLLRWFCGKVGIAGDVVGAFGVLMALAASGIAIVLMLLLDRLIFGPRERGKLPTWLKVVTALGLGAAVALAIWTGTEHYRSEHPTPVAANPDLEKLQHDPDVLKGMAAIRDMQKLKAEREQGPATTPATNP